MEKVVRNWDQRKDAENDEIYHGICEKCCDAGRGTIQVCWYLLGVAQGCRLSPNLSTEYINDMIAAVEAAKEGVTVGEGKVSRLVFANDFVGRS